jgi:hypothetical protein
MGVMEYCKSNEQKPLEHIVILENATFPGFLPSSMKAFSYKTSVPHHSSTPFYELLNSEFRNPYPKIKASRIRREVGSSDLSSYF